MKGSKQTKGSGDSAAVNPFERDTVEAVGSESKISLLYPEASDSGHS